MEYGYIMEFKNIAEPEDMIAVICGGSFRPNGSMPTIPIALIEGATLNEKTGFHEMPYSQACATVAGALASGDNALVESIVKACAGTFPVWCMVNVPRQALTVCSVDPVHKEYTCTEFFRLMGKWVHSYQLQKVDLPATLMYAVNFRG